MTWLYLLIALVVLYNAVQIYVCGALMQGLVEGTAAARPSCLNPECVPKTLTSLTPRKGLH